MKTLSLSEIQVGDAYEQSVFLPAGQKLIPPHTPIDERHLDILKKHGYSTVYLADSSDEVHIATGRRRGPANASHAAPDGEEPAPEEADDSTAELTRLNRRRVKMVDTLIGHVRELAEKTELTIRPEEREIWDFARDARDPWPAQAELVELREAMVERLRVIYSRIQYDDVVEFSQIAQLVDELYDLLLHHRVRFTQLALLVPRRDDYLADHAMCVAVLAMATAAQLTWSRENIRTIGMTAMVSDLGMMLVPDRIRSGGEQLSDIDRGRVQRHTGYTLAMLESVNGVPNEVKLAAFQHHERENGSGYPLGLRCDGIYDVARVLAVADVLAAQMSPRHYRKHKLPYIAMEQMVRAAASSQFSKPAVRALVQAAGLFPVGSCVKLSNRKTARVIAANPNHLDRPIVQLLTDDGSSLDQPIDLSQLPTKALAVVKPIAAPDSPTPSPTPQSQAA